MIRSRSRCASAPAALADRERFEGRVLEVRPSRPDLGTQLLAAVFGADQFGVVRDLAREDGRQHEPPEQKNAATKNAIPPMISLHCAISS